jgi:Transcriptional regulators
LKLKQLKHKRVELELRQLAATLPAGAKLPAERDLAIEYQCNFLTVRKALKQLVNDGLITRRIGSGTFIAPKETPPPAAGSGPRQNRIGLLVYEKGNAYAFGVLQAIAHVALTESVELRSCWVRDFADDGLRQAEMMKKEGCVALTLPWFPHTMTEAVRSFVLRCPIPVSLPILIPGLEKYCFEKSLFGATLLTGTEALGQYFVKLGHSRIAFLGPDAPGDLILQQKLGSYSCFTSRENLQMLCGLVPPGTQAMDRLAARWKAYRGDLAIISYDDEHALRFMTAMHKLGLSAPADFCIVGYNNTDASHYSDPPLSTVAQNFEYVGQWLLKSALALARGEVSQSTENPALKFLVRQTCGGREKIDADLIRALHDLKLDVICENPPSAETAASHATADAIS